MEYQGKLLRKKKRHQWMVIIIEQDTSEQGHNKLSREIHLPLHEPLIVGGNPLTVTYKDNQQYLFLHAVLSLKVFYHPVSIDGDDKVKALAREIKLIRCAPIPAAIEIALKSIADGDGRFHPNALMARQSSFSSTECPDEPTKNLSHEAIQILSLPSRDRRLALGTLVRRLRGIEEPRQPRVRLPHTKRADIKVIHHLEHVGRTNRQGSWRLIEPNVISFRNEKTIPDLLWAPGPFNLPNIVEQTTNDETTGSVPSCRQKYLTQKKHPQIQWMVRRITTVRKDRMIRHILDVGGGRGDLAAALALALPDVFVTVVDKNKSSLDAAQDFAKLLGLSDRIHFAGQDFRDYHGKPESVYLDLKRSMPPPVDMVVALHACGDLSDLALVHAEQRGCMFVVCPCCYTKRYMTNFSPPWCSVLSESDVLPLRNGDETQGGEHRRAITTLMRLAEMNERRDLGQRAMIVINSLRLHSVRKVADFEYSIELYDDKSSKRNLVLVGIC